MSEGIRPFLIEGIRRYAEARGTVLAFETEMLSIFNAVLRERRKWSPLAKTTMSRPSVGGVADDDGFWMAAVISGRTAKRESAKIDCGLWWNAVGRQEPIIYANFYYQPKRLMAFSWPDGKNGIGSFFAWDRTFLFVPLKDPADVRPGINKLLDAMLRQLT